MSPMVISHEVTPKEKAEMEEWERVKKRLWNEREMTLRIKALRRQEFKDPEAMLHTYSDLMGLLRDPEKELPPDRCPEEETSRPFVEPVPMINPPPDWANKTPLRYAYSALPKPTSIRVIKIELLEDFDNGDDDETHEAKRYSPIRCSIEVVDLEDRPDFFALSYTWGDPRTIYTNKEDIFPPEAWHAPSFTIECDDQQITVGTNLYCALVALRAAWSGLNFVFQNGPDFCRQSGDLNKVHFWIDALCINQEDIEEKNTQVSMMDRIYSQAQATVMWLGNGEELVSIGALHTMGKFEQVVRKLREQDQDNEDSNGHGNSDDENDEHNELLNDYIRENIWTNNERVQQACANFDLTDADSYRALGLEPVLPHELIGWYLLFSRSWFHRAWVVQEWALSRRCVFLCGILMFKCRTIIDIMPHFVYTGWLRQIEIFVTNNILDVETDGVPSWNTVPDTRHRALMQREWTGEMWDTPALYRAPWANYGLSRQSYHLEQYIQVLRARLGYGPDGEKLPRGLVTEIRQSTAMSPMLFRPAQATDPRDKVFAFYSLFKDENGAHLYPSPDYNKDVRQVYIEAAISLAKEHGTKFFGFISRETNQESIHNLPSWVPDFSDTDPAHFTPPCFQRGKFDAGAGIQSLQSVYVFSFEEGPMDFDGYSREELNAHGLMLSEDDLKMFNEKSRESMNGTVLGLSARHVDTISQVQEEPVGACNLVYGFRELHELLSRLPEVSDIGTLDGGHVQQSRYEVYWRTKVFNICLHPSTYPAPIEQGEVHMRRLEMFLYMQMKHCQMNSFLQIVKEISKETAECPSTDPALTKCLEDFTSNDLIPSIEKFLEMMGDSFSMDTSEIFNREKHSESIAVINTYLAMLKGEQSYEDYQSVVPDFWNECEEAWDEVLRARAAGDYEWFHESATRSVVMLIDDEKFKQQEMDRALGLFEDDNWLFATEHGRLGRNPGGAEVGDQIWLMAGLHTPIILRKLDWATYKVVGCAYVHGIMHGEGAGDGKARKILLR